MSTPNIKFRKIQKHSSVSQKPTSCDKIKLYSRLDKQIKKKQIGGKKIVSKNTQKSVLNILSIILIILYKLNYN